MQDDTPYCILMFLYEIKNKYVHNVLIRNTKTEQSSTKAFPTNKRSGFLKWDPSDLLKPIKSVYSIFALDTWCQILWCLTQRLSASYSVSLLSSRTISKSSKITKKSDFESGFGDMDGRNGWVEKGGSRSCPDKTIMERIMLRFRPIAPKPASGEPVPGSSAEGEGRDVLRNERKKRKYVRVKETRSKKDKKKGELKSEDIFDFELLQDKISGLGGLYENGSSINLDFKVEDRLPGSMKLDNKSGENKGVESENIFDFELLQPKIDVFRGFNECGSSVNLDFKVDETIPGSLENNGYFGGGGMVDQVDRREVKVVESWMMVEGVNVMSDMWFGEGGLGSTDMEKQKNLEMDVCPGLISDGFDRVQWVNLAYRNLVDPPKDEGEAAADVLVWLVVKEKLPLLSKAFACTVRVVYSWGYNNRDDDNNICNNSNKKYISQTMPCDVWRMDFGGFAWRLDSKAALSLGR